MGGAGVVVLFGGGGGGAPAVGYTISRDDVGKWIFESFVKEGKAWVGQKVSLTY